MPIVLCNLQRENRPGPLVVSCSILGDPSGFEQHPRKFSSDRDVMLALRSAGIRRDRYIGAFSASNPGKAPAFEISVCEAQKLDLLRIDSTE
jgi:hypothetical protein